MVVSEDAKCISFDPQKLAAALRERGISNAEYARKACYKHRSTITKIINAERRATADDLLRACLILNLEPADLRS